MQFQIMKEKLKKFKGLFPKSMQSVGVSFWKEIELALEALMERRSILKTNRVFWPAPEVADFNSVKMLGPTKDEILVDVAYSVISPGTERAQLLGLPGVLEHIPDVPYFPGYSGSGKVLVIGKNVKKFKVGDRVAGRIQHGSPSVVKENLLFHVPNNVSLEKAAFIELGIIVLQGIHKAYIQPGESVIIIGQGIIGQIALRLSRIVGGTPVVAVARTIAKESASLSAGGADWFQTIKELKSGEDFDVVIDSTGDPNIFPLACSLIRSGGRIIGLGTPFGQGVVNLGKNSSKSNISIIGAHISGVPNNEQTTRYWTYRNEGELFLNLLDQNKFSFDNLITHRINPEKANEIYESLRVGNSKMIGIIFEWNKQIL